MIKEIAISLSNKRCVGVWVLPSHLKLTVQE